MTTQHVNNPTSQITQEQLLTLVRVMTGDGRGRPDDEHPLPPGPWDPLIRAAYERVQLFEASEHGGSAERDAVAFASIAARHPEIFDAMGGGRRGVSEVELNPQPLPPRARLIRAIAQTFTERAELIHEFADASRRAGQEERGIIIVSGYVAKFADDFCGTDFRLKHPVPGPRPRWFSERLDGADLLVMAAHLDRTANETFAPELRDAFASAAATFAEASLRLLR